MSSKQSKKAGRDAAAPITDSRFANFNTDPRFRLPSRKHAKTTIDERFSHMLNDESFITTARVDRYGRKVKTDARKKVLERLYAKNDIEGREKGDDDENEDKQEKDEDGNEEDDDEWVEGQISRQAANYDPARHGGYSSSGSDSDSDSEVEVDDDEEIRGPGRLDGEVEAGDITRRIAIVNMDWDHVKSADLLALFTSFLPKSAGSIERVSVYPSEFGKERMQREEVEGPPRDIFKSGGKKRAGADSDSGDEDLDSEAEDERIKNSLITEGNDEDFDNNALRAYQLDRLRYFYAVMVCSDAQTAQALYEATDGTEFQSSSNFLDLRFVPDDVTFEDEPRDECDRMPESYKPVEFVTNALQSSKVKLTWDMNPDDATRKDSLKRAFGGSRAEMGENDLKAYLASDSDSDDYDEPVVEVVGEDGIDETEEPKLSKKELARKKMREALGLGDEPTAKKSKGGPVGDMQVTFTAALTEKDDEDDGIEREETTIEKYKRKEKERKEMKRQAAKAKRDGVDPEASADNNEEEDEGKAEEDLGFDDPFFTTADTKPAVSKSSILKEERRKKREAREAQEAEAADQRATLKRVMATRDSEIAGTERLDHFDMAEILRAEKRKGKKEKYQKKKNKDDEDEDEAKKGLQEDFEMAVDDDRFRAVFEDHTFAIDPSNPKFVPTQGMKKVLEEGRRKRKGDERDGSDRPDKKSKRSQAYRDAHGGDLSGLVASVKKKAKGGKRG